MDKSYLIQELKNSYSWIQEHSLESEDVVVNSLPGPEMIIGERKIVSFCSNNYLGLAHRDEVRMAASEALEAFGQGTCESRRLGGNLQLLDDLEDRIARFKGTEGAIVFATGLLANVGAIPSLVDSAWYLEKFYGREHSNRKSVILSDAFNHRSIQMGIKLARAESYKYRHCDMDHLEELLRAHEDDAVLIITDGVFSMHGNLAPLDKIVELAKRYSAAIMVDDAHGTGVFGKLGRGSAEHFGVEDEIQIRMGTLSKALGGLGGFIAAEKPIVDLLKVTSSAYYFTSGLPANQAAGLIKAFDIIEEEPNLRHRLWENIYHATVGLKTAGFKVPQQLSCIIPVHIGSEAKSMEAEKILLDEGFLCSSVRMPAVQIGKSILRITINSGHTREHINSLIDAMNKVATKINLPLEPMDRKDVEKLLRNKVPAYMQVSTSN